MTAYTVVVDKGECPMCHEGALWTVQGPGEVCIGESFSEEVDAEEMAGMLNAAHKAAQEAMRERCLDSIGPVCNREEALEAIRALPIE